MSFESLQNMINAKNLTITSDWAFPLGGNRVNLIGNPNFIKFKGDSVQAFLPYFGTVQVLADYGGDGGISFNGIPKSYEVIPQMENKDIKIKFEMNNKTENFQVTATLFKNGSANVSVNSSYRNSISYQGNFKENDENKEKGDSN